MQRKMFIVLTCFLLGIFLSTNCLAKEKPGKAAAAAAVVKAKGKKPVISKEQKDTTLESLSTQELLTQGEATQIKPVEQQTSIQTTAPAEQTIKNQNITLEFNEADIRNVLKIISFKAGVNIVASPDVIGNVSIRLVDVPWERALDIILKTYGFGYERQGNVILVAKLENISKIQAEEPLRTEIINLKFLDSNDARRVIIPLLSERGTISILYTRGQKGWQFGTFQIGKGGQTQAGEREKDVSDSQVVRETISASGSKSSEPTKKLTNQLEISKAELSIKSKILVITDTVAALDKIKDFIAKIDRKPKQVIIETKIMEVNNDRLKDIGFDWGTGTSGANGYATPPTDLSADSKDKKTVAGRSLGSEFTPSLFGPKEGAATFPGNYPYRAGLEVIFKKVSGTQFESIIHALEEDAHTNTLSSPRIMTLDNQEASILVGYHTPILTSSVTAGTTTSGPTQTQGLDYYQEIGIRLNVVPQISEENYINMIVHPSVTSSTSNVTATNVAGTGADAITSTVDYPVIDVREAQTQIMMKNGETIVIGGLMKDVKSKQKIGIPFISKIPLIGNFFTRETVDTAKIDLMIFITARIVEDDEFAPEKIALLEKSLGMESAVKTKVKK